MNDLVSALEQIIEFLKHSEDSIWSHSTVAEVIELLESELHNIKHQQPFNKLKIKILYAPTSDIQEISLRNDWSEDYVEIAKIIDSSI